MTAVMRAVAQQSGPKILRIGVVQGGKVVDERLIKQRTHVTIGPSEKAMFVVPSRKVPPSFKLFELIGNDYHLNFLEGMTGRLALKTGVTDLNAIAAQSKLIQDKAGSFHRVHLNDDARGKVVVGQTTFLFQFVAPPPVQPKPQLPMSVRKGVAGDIDWFTTIVASFSFLLHFFLVALVYSDWMDPIVKDEDAIVSQLVESVKSLPPPPPIEKQKSDTATESSAAVATDTKAPKASTTQAGPAPKNAAGAGDKSASSNPGNAGDKAAGERAAADAKAAELASALADLDVQTLGALGSGGVAVDNVLGNGEVPAGMLDEAARSGAGAGSGEPSGLKAFGSGSGKGGTGPLGGSGGTGDLSTKGERGASAGGGGVASGEGKKAEVKGPTGNANVGGAGVAGGAVANASSVVARMKGRFRACYQAGLNSNPEMAGTVTLVATIGPNGEVQGVSGGGGSLGPIIGCLKSVVQSAAFSPPDGGRAVVSIPITFVKQ